MSKDGLTPAQRLLLDESVNEIGLPVRTTNHLEERGIFTVRELLNSSREDLLSISNFGDKTLDEVYKKLAEHGFVAPGYQPPTPPPEAAKHKKPAFKMPAPYRPQVRQFRSQRKPKE